MGGTLVVKIQLKAVMQFFWENNRMLYCGKIINLKTNLL
jgi:hypothetical protein